MRNYRHRIANSLIAFIIALIFASCTSTKDVAYFKDIADTTKMTQIADAPYHDPLIIPDDILSVTLVTIDPTSSIPVNQAATVPVSTSGSPSLGTSQLVPGLLVDKNGNISLPIIGTVKVGGLTTFQAKALIKSIAEKYYKEPDVQLRFVNFKITVIGEVARPSIYTIPSEKVSVLDALGMAGDLTIYGHRENVLLIREEDGVKKLIRLNLNSAELFKSPYFYLKQNDVIYVQPNKSKAIQADAEQTRVITIAAAVLTGLFLYLRVK